MKKVKAFSDTLYNVKVTNKVRLLRNDRPAMSHDSQAVIEEEEQNFAQKPHKGGWYQDEPTDWLL